MLPITAGLLMPKRDMGLDYFPGWFQPKDSVCWLLWTRNNLGSYQGHWNTI